MRKEQQSNPDILVSVDIVLFCLKDKRLHVVLHRRDHEPFSGQLALPGGYVQKQVDADALSAAVRVLKKKTGIAPPYLEQLFTFADGARDPRGWSVSLSYFALVDIALLQSALEQGGEQELFELVDVEDVPRLSFDHNRILEMGLQRLRDKSAYSTLPCFLLGEQFTMGELYETYQHVMGVELNKSVFRRKMAELDVLEESQGLRTGAHRPAQLFSLKSGVTRKLTVLDRPIRTTTE